MPDTYSIGTQYDTAATAGGNGTVIALLKRLTTDISAGADGVGPTVTTAVTVNGQSVSLTDIEGAGTVLLEAVGAYTASFSIEGTADGTNWRAVRASPFTGGPQITTNPTADTLYAINSAGLLGVRLRCTAFTSGPTVTLRAVIASQYQHVALPSTSGALADGVTNTVSQQVSSSSGFMGQTVYPLLFNGTTWDRMRSPGLGTSAVGKFRVTITNSPTVGTGTAYANGDTIGTLQTLSSVFRLANGAALLKSVTISNKSGIADIAIGIRVWFFNANPSGSTFTDNLAMDIVDADITKVLGYVEISTAAAVTSGEVWSAKNVDLHLVAASAGTGLHVAMQSLGAIAANVGTTDFQLTLGVEQE